MALIASIDTPRRCAIVRIGSSDDRSSLITRSRVSPSTLVPLPQNRPLLSTLAIVPSVVARIVPFSTLQTEGVTRHLDATVVSPGNMTVSKRDTAAIQCPPESNINNGGGQCLDPLDSLTN